MVTIDAAKQAGRARFRPVLLTSITTVAGLTPLLREKSLQAPILAAALVAKVDILLEAASRCPR